MHVISRRKLRDFWEHERNAEIPLSDWYKIAKNGKWLHFAELKMVFSSADFVGSCIIFNIGGNKYRLITYINFERQKLYTLHVLTHKEYDKGKWKKDCDS